MTFMTSPGVNESLPGSTGSGSDLKVGDRLPERNAFKKEEKCRPLSPCKGLSMAKSSMEETDTT
jgi:hypothetical protein